MNSRKAPFLALQRNFSDWEEYPVEGASVLIGSAEECAIRDTEGLLAPKQAEIVRSGEQFLLRDFGTPDGSFVNGNPVEGTALLKHSDVIQIGSWIMTFHFPGEPEERRISARNTFGFEELAKLTEKLSTNIGKVFKGKDQVIRNLIVCLLADGHLLLEDAPGVGKSLLAQALARSINARYRRIQFTPDMMPSDITGMNIFDSGSNSFRFMPGPIFGNVILADEINRTTPRTQSSLLECMAEGVVTADGCSRILPKPFFVIATQNPEDYHGTYPLPEPQLDRFTMRMSVGYPSPESELEILSGARQGSMLNTISGVVEPSDLLRAQAFVRKIEVSDGIKRYIIAIADATREHQALVNGCSPRAALALMRAAQSLAGCEQHDFVSPKEVRELVPVILAHRMSLKLRWKAQYKSVENVLEEILSQIRLPNEGRR